MQCKHCGSDNCQLITETDVKTNGYNASLGCCGLLFFWNPIGLLCGLCGMGDTERHSRSYWICHNCGHKFRA